MSSILITIAVNQTNHVFAVRLHSSVENLYLKLEKSMKMYLEDFFYFFVWTLILFFKHIICDNFFILSEIWIFDIPGVLVICSQSDDSYSTSWLKMQALQCEYMSIYISSPPSIGMCFFDHVFVRIFVNISNCLIVSI